MARKLAGEDFDSDRSTQVEESDDEHTDGGRLLNRRDYVKLSAVTAGTVIASTGVGSAAVERHGIQFDRVLDAVEDLGMDPNGDDPIDSALSSAYETGTLIEFPEGTYRIDDEAPISGSKSRFGMRGLGDSQRDVQFVFPNAASSDGYWAFRQYGGTDVLYENFSIQLTDDHETSVSIQFDVNDNGLAIDLEWLGFIPPQVESNGSLLRMNVDGDRGATTEGVNIARRITMGKQGSHLGGHMSSTDDTPGTTFMRHDTSHIGELRLEDVHFEQCGHNAMRSTNNDGVVTVKGGYFLNCDVSSLRFQGGDHPTKTSVIDGAHIEKDHSKLNDTGGTEPHQGAGIMVDSRVGNSGLVIRNCDIEYKDLSVAPDNAGSLWGVIRVTDTANSNPGGITIENTRIHNETLAPNLWFQTIDSGAKQPHEVVLDGVHLTSESEKSRNIDSLVYFEEGRDGSVIRNCCFYAPNGDVDAVLFEGCDDVVVEDSNINVTGEAVQLQNSDGNVRNITHDATCDVPDFSNDDSNSDDSTDDDSNSGDSTDDSSDETDGSDGDWTSLAVDGTDSDTTSEYEFVVDGDARENTELSEYGTVNTIETLDDGTVRVAGAIRSGVDAFDYTGSIRSFTAGDDMDLERDGELITRDEVVDGDSDTDESTDDGSADSGSDTDDSTDDSSESDDSTDETDSSDSDWISFAVNGTDSDTTSEYEFVVDGDARENMELSEYGTVSTIEALDDGTVRVAGAIRSGVDAFDYTGAIRSFTAGDDMEFSRGGTEISRDEVVDSTYEHSLRIVGTGTTSTYEFAVDGEVAAAPGCEGECADAISGTEVAGELSSGTASFRFDGDVTEFSLDGEAGVYLDDRQVDADLLGTDADPFLENWLTVDGIEDETSYQFAVSGTLHKSPDLGSAEADDVIEDGMVIGSVSDDVDGYRFNGDVTMMRVQGTAELRFDEE
ncbi:hypothetical protein [Halobellus litoreus]|uniref:Right handed beta helix region n=1 Tax=Halobellus litoreus TaxID=755310 RepID=A0ABD6DYN3_9EURY|nr:hypothetical protein [Halobellus litoreus]